MAQDQGAASSADGRKLVELSHTIVHGMQTYPGLPGPEISEHLTREASAALYGPGVQFSIGRVSMIGNTGTYVDSPFHRYAHGADFGSLPLERLADLDGITVDVAGSRRRAIDASELASFDVRGRAVLLHTGWDRNWRKADYSTGAPFLTQHAADWLVNAGVALVGIDSVNIDDIDDRMRPVHSALLAAGIPIVEHLAGLEQLPPRGFRFHAAPPRIEKVGTFPVRAYAVIA